MPSPRSSSAASNAADRVRGHRITPLLAVRWVAAVLVGLVLVCEIGLRMRDAYRAGSDRHASEVPLHVTVDSPELFRLNPEHPQISSQGLRNREVPILKPLGSRRVLVLGDSIVFGVHVAPDATFPARLGERLSASGTPVEVIDAGVPGYTPYNELQWYRTRGRLFHADVVLVVFNMDDVANPRLHWRRYATAAGVPDAAVPNSRYDREVVQPRLASGPPPGRWLEKSHLLRELGRRIAWLRPAPPAGTPDLSADPPTFLTAEDDRPIAVLADERSPEWQWLVRIYEQLRAAVEADGAVFAIAVMPLAYQLEAGAAPDADSPQSNFARFCARRSIPCIDLLPGMSGVSADELFLLDRFGERDVWNPTAAGHELVANRLAGFLEGLLELR